MLNDQISSVDMDSIWWYAPTEESIASDMNGVFKSCPKPELQQDFNMTSFLGQWYQLYMDEGGDGHECTTTDISLKDDGTFDQFNSGQVYNNETGSLAVANGFHIDFRQKEGTTDGQLQLQFFRHTPWIPYDVVATDYESYVVVLSCMDFGVTKNEQHWVLTREPFQQGT
jgi:lipocalin